MEIEMQNDILLDKQFEPAMKPAQEPVKPTESMLSTCVRYAGIGCTTIGALLLMVEGLGKVSAEDRFFSFSAILGLCAAAGIQLSAKPSNQRSARLLIGMFLALISVFWSQLGAVVFSFFAPHLSNVPGMFLMSEVSTFGFVSALAIAAGIIIPLTSVAARIFVSRNSKFYAAIISAFGVLASVPLRSGAAADMVVLAVVALLTFVERRSFAPSSRTLTKEDFFARAVLFVLPASMVVRNMFYHGSSAVDGAIFSLLGLAAYWAYDLMIDRPRAALQVFGDTFFALAASCIAGCLRGYLPAADVQLFEYSFPALFLIGAGLENQTKKSVQLMIGASVLVLGGACLGAYGTFLTALAAIVFPVIGIAIALNRRSAFLIAVSLLGLFANVNVSFVELLKHIESYRWSLLMVGGIVMVASASYLEPAMKKVKMFWIGK